MSHHSKFRYALGVALLVFTIGCSWTSRDGTRHSLVLGLGVLRSSGTNCVGVNVEEFSGLGVGVQQNGFYAGWAKSHSVSIDPHLITNDLVKVHSTSSKLDVTTRRIDPATEKGLPR